MSTLRVVDQAGARAHLESHGFPAATAAGLAASFDWTQPVYISHLEPGQRLVQFVRSPWGGTVEGRVYDSSYALGNFFGLPGATQDGVAIGNGLSRRLEQEFEVQRPITALEGTAGHYKPAHVAASIGGPGGTTQLILSHAQRYALTGAR
jgi:hypothetical protein